jgi:hypothetical protein
MFLGALAVRRAPATAGKVRSHLVGDAHPTVIEGETVGNESVPVTGPLGFILLPGGEEISPR